MTVFNRRRLYSATDSDIAVLKRCFLLGNIKVVYYCDGDDNRLDVKGNNKNNNKSNNHTKNNNNNISSSLSQLSPQTILTKYLILLSKYFQFMHNSFNMKIIFSNTIKYYYQ
jgi:hypothetical protein